MRVRSPQPRRLVPVRLSDVDVALRLRALERLLRLEDDPLRRFELLAAAHTPSRRVYFLPAEAVDRVLAAKSGRHRKRRLAGARVRA